MKNRAKVSLKFLPATYAGLIAFHAPRPIHDEIGCQNTVEIVDALAGHQLTGDQEDYLQLLSQTIEAYEAEVAPKAKIIPGADSLQFLLAENELNGDDLAALLGIDRSAAFKILKGSRALTLTHVRKLAERFRVSADLFLPA